MTAPDRTAELEHALLALTLAAWGSSRERKDSPRQRRLRAELAQAHRVLFCRHDPIVEPESPLQVVHAAIDYAEARGIAWPEIVALVNRRARSGEPQRTPEGAR